MTNLPRATAGIPLTVKPLSATFTMSVTGYLGINLAPYLIEIITSAVGAGVVTAGWVVTGMLLATAVVGLATSPLCVGRGRRPLAQIGLLVASIAFTVAALLPGPVTVVAGLLIGGAGAGCAVAAAGAAFAAFSDPERVGGAGAFANRAIAAALLAIVPALGLSPLSVIGSLAVFCIASLLLSVWLPEAPATSAQTPAVATTHGASPAVPAANKKALLFGFTILAVFAVWGISEDSLWSTSIILATDQAGVPTEMLGLMLSGATAGGMIGAALLIIAGKRLGRAVPLVTLMLLCSAAKLTMGLLTDPTMFVIVFVAWNALYAMAFAYFISTAAALDESGRWSGPLLAVYLVGSSLAPVVGTALATAFGSLWFTVIISGTSALLAIVAGVIASHTTRLERQRTNLDATAPNGDRPVNPSTDATEKSLTNA